MTDEKYVQAHWQVDDLGAKLAPIRVFDWPSVHAFKSWSAAAEFARERLEQIREIEEERAMLCGKVLLEDRDMAAVKRILARLESALADLRKGLKA